MHFKNVKFLLLVQLLSAPAFLVTAQEVPQTEQPRVIKQIHIHGNSRTRIEIVKLYFNIDTGMVYDSLQLRKGKQELESTGLFSKVDVFPFVKKEGVHVYIILAEKPYLLPGLSGEIYNYKYGFHDPWWRLRVSLDHTNFRGKMEVLKTNFSIWDWKDVGISWQKPLLPSPYYFGIGSNIDNYPDEIEYTDHTSISGKLTAGRKVSSNSKTAISVIPSFKREIRHLQDTTFSSLKTPDVSGEILSIDTLINTRIDTLKAYEAFGAIGWVSDFRNSTYDPVKGWYFYTDIRTNYLHSGKYSPFIQFTSDFRIHHPGIFANNKVVYRVATVFRNTDGGPLHRIQQGGEGSIRGYPRRRFGLYSPVNNSIIFSTEYRFPIYEFPPIKVPILSNYSGYFASVYYRIDGALIMDYGRLSKDFSELFQTNSSHIESGTGIGFGLRLMFPTFERSICADFVWGDDPNTSKIDFKWPGMPHLYLDLYF